MKVVITHAEAAVGCLVSFRSRIGSAVGVWMSDVAPQIGSTQHIELEVNEFEIETVLERSESKDQGQSATLRMVDEVTAELVAKVRGDQIDGLIELDLYDGMLSIETRERFSSGDWVRLKTTKIQIWPYSL